MALSPPPYWKKLAFRYPGMVRDLHGQMRIGVESEQAIVNSVLPGAAAHNLVLGGELLVATAPGLAATVAAAAGSGRAQDDRRGPAAQDVLHVRQPVAGVCDARPGRRRAGQPAKDAPFEFAIKIIGDDLEADGITRNQSIRDFKQENQTVADILTALVRKANPDPP